MSLGSSYQRTDSKESRSIAGNLKRHAELYTKYLKEGLTEKEADAKAFNDIKKGAKK